MAFKDFFQINKESKSKNCACDYNWPGSGFGTFHINVHFPKLLEIEHGNGKTIVDKMGKDGHDQIAGPKIEIAKQSAQQ